MHPAEDTTQPETLVDLWPNRCFLPKREEPGPYMGLRPNNFVIHNQALFSNRVYVSSPWISFKFYKESCGESKQFYPEGDPG